MAPARIHGLVGLLWLASSAALTAHIGQQTDWKLDGLPDTPKPRLLAAAPLQVEPLPDYRPPRLEKSYPGTLERPLFVPTRRKSPPPPPPAPVEPPKPVMKKGQFQLLGTIITDEFSAAVLREVATGKLRQVELDRLINGLRLEQVSPDQVVFTQYDDSETLPLKVQPSPTKAAPPAPGKVETGVVQAANRPGRPPRINRRSTQRDGAEGDTAPESAPAPQPSAPPQVPPAATPGPATAPTPQPPDQAGPR